MKKLLKFSFLAYHAVFASKLASCRYTPTCSQYMLDAVDKFGTAKGLLLTIKRVASCHPFSKKPYLDPA